VKREEYTEAGKNKKGTPQGGVISPLLSNIYLHLLDKIAKKEGGIFRQSGIEIVRYADDFILMGKAIPAYILEKLNHILSRMKLSLNHEKSRQINAYNEPFDFLGFTFRHDRSLYNRKQKYWNVRPSKKSENKLREKLRKYFKGCRHRATENVAKGINLITRGWVNYFHIPKVSYLRKICENLEYYMERKFHRHFAKKSQRKCRLFHKGGLVRQMEKYGLFSPIRMLQPVNA
jgi:RNA-directed DNA polymerase